MNFWEIAPYFFMLLLAASGSALVITAIFSSERKSKYFIQSKSRPAKVFPALTGGGAVFSERDNMGSRHDTRSKADGYWMARQGKMHKEPFILCTFPTAQSARSALLALPCIHQASDTGGLICTETLAFGHYENEMGKHEAVLAGDDMTLELFQAAKQSFARHGGERHGQGELAPSAKAAAKRDSRSVPIGSVTFLREYSQRNALGTNCTYRIHKAPNEATAKKFLQENPVSRQLFYLVVETPMGNWARDINGIYQE